MSQFINICTGGQVRLVCPTDSRWMRLMVVKLQADNKGSHCAGAAASGSRAQTAAGREGSGGRNRAHAAGLGMSSAGPLATHACVLITHVSQLNEPRCYDVRLVRTKYIIQLLVVITPEIIWFVN